MLKFIRSRKEEEVVETLTALVVVNILSIIFSVSNFPHSYLIIPVLLFFSADIQVFEGRCLGLFLQSFIPPILHLSIGPILPPTHLSIPPSLHSFIPPFLPGSAAWHPFLYPYIFSSVGFFTVCVCIFVQS